MRGQGKAAALAPFKVRSFRFQWPADLLTSWAFEMETLVLGWYILVETESVLLLTAVGALQFIGTLIAPMFGVVGDRLGRRTTLCFMRAFYTILATIMMALGLSGELTPYHVFVIVFLMGLVRQSDLVMRNSLIGDTMPPDRLMSALSLSRTTQDTARIAGALAGAGLFSVLGIGATYVFVACFYALSLALTFGVSKVRPVDEDADGDAPRVSPWRDLKEGLSYVRRTPNVQAILWLAFLVNLCAYPITNGLLPYTAKEIYQIDAIGLGHLAAGFAVGAFIGSLLIVWTGGPRRAARFALINISLWYLLLMIFAQLSDKTSGIVLLVVIGIVQGTAMISMSVILISAVPSRYRGRVLGVRMLAVYGLPLGLMASGVFIDWVGYPFTVTLYCLVGLAGVTIIGLKYREVLWK